MKIKKETYYGFDHKKVNEMLSGDLTFVNEFCVNGEYKPVAVYHAANPDRAKGHKDYVLLQTQRDPVTEKLSGIVRGMNADEIEKFRYTSAIHCLDCDTVMFSMNRHHFHKCECPNEAFIDGGNESYNRYGAKSMARIKLIKLDLLTDTVKSNV